MCGMGEGFSAQIMCSCKDSCSTQGNSQQFVEITVATSPSAGGGDVLGGRFLQEF